jgi:hypothetical protein
MEGVSAVGIEAGLRGVYDAAIAGLRETLKRLQWRGDD